MSKKRPDRLVTIGRFWTVAGADLAKAILDSDGIPAVLADVHTRLVVPHAVREVRLQVMARDARRAVELLQRRKQQDTSLEGELAELPKCPKCGSLEVKYGQPSRALAILSVLLLFIPLIFTRRRWRCTDCGHMWKA
jgi:hypothetical protein